MKWRNSKERELIAHGGCREQTLPTKNNPNPDLSDPRPQLHQHQDQHQDHVPEHRQQPAAPSPPSAPTGARPSDPIPRRSGSSPSSSVAGTSTHLYPESGLHTSSAASHLNHLTLGLPGSFGPPSSLFGALHHHQSSHAVHHLHHPSLVLPWGLDGQGHRALGSEGTDRGGQPDLDPGVVVGEVRRPGHSRPAESVEGRRLNNDEVSSSSTVTIGRGDDPEDADVNVDEDEDEDQGRGATEFRRRGGAERDGRGRGLMDDDEDDVDGDDDDDDDDDSGGSND